MVRHHTIWACKNTPKNAKNSQNWPKGAKKGQSQSGRGGRDIISYRLFRKLEIAFVPVFSRDVFFIKLIWQNENFIIFHNIFFLQIFKNMLYIRVIFLLRECWIMLPTLLICNSQEATNRHSYCIIWQQHKEIPLTWGIFKYDVIITLFSAEVHVHQHKGIFAGV